LVVEYEDKFFVFFLDCFAYSALMLVLLEEKFLWKETGSSLFKGENRKQAGRCLWLERKTSTKNQAKSGFHEGGRVEAWENAESRI